MTTAIRRRWSGLSRGRKWLIGAALAAGLAGTAAIGSVALVVIAWVVGNERAAAGTFSQTFNVGGQAVIVSRVNQPDGSFFVEVRDAASGALLIRSSCSASPFSRWFIADDQGVIWFYSGDVGMFLYVRSGDGTWRELAWVPGNEVSKQYRIPDAVYSKLGPGRQKQFAPWRKIPG